MTDLNDPSLSHVRPRATTRCPHTAAELRAARMACAASAVAKYPEDGDPRAVGDLAGLLDALGLLPTPADASAASPAVPGSTTRGTR